ncbi:MAG: VWA domain-containing protein, partial [Chitinophagales bacterium]
LKNHDETVKILESKIEDLQKEIEQVRKEKQQLTEQITQLEVTVTEKDVEIKKEQTKVEDLTESNDALKKELEKAKNEAEAAKAEVNQQKKQLKECQAKLGLDVGDNVVFVVDISGSMDDDPEPQKLDEVKAGIKMMVATMDETTSVDIVIYPKSADERYGYKYGRLQPVTEDTKYDIYRYLSTLRAYGCTPTKEVMDFVFDSPNYKNANTIILMSDGLPTVRTSATKCDELSSTGEIEDYITSKNGGSKVINCIGVGSDFRQRNSNDLKVKFMQNLARKNNGFYIGF